MIFLKYFFKYFPLSFKMFCNCVFVLYYINNTLNAFLKLVLERNVALESS